MLSLRGEQMTVLDRASMEGFVRRVASRLRSGQGDLVSGVADGELQAQVRAAAHAAQKYSITSEKHVFEFITFSILLGPGFETSARYAWAQAILADESVGAATKVLQIRKRLESTFADGAQG